MKKLICSCLFAAALSSFAGNAANPDAVELAPIPLPVEFASDMDRPVAFDAKTPASAGRRTRCVRSPSPGAASRATRRSTRTLRMCRSELVAP